MAWLQKRPQVTDPTSYYSIGLNRTVLVVGLGNIGDKYENTRHNVGFLCLDYFVSHTEELASKWVEQKKLKCLEAKGRVGNTQVIAIKPTTYMNNSGEAVQAIVNFYKIAPDNILVVHDELDIDFGQIRLRRGGSSAGHNGIKSISQSLGFVDYGRVRIGIGPKPANTKSETYVLQPWSADQKTQLTNLTREVAAVLSEYTYGNDLTHETRSFLV